MTTSQEDRTLSIDAFGQALLKRRQLLSPSSLVVLDYIDAYRHAALEKSALQIANETGTSDATVIRAIQSLGYSGLVELKQTLSKFMSDVEAPQKKLVVTTGEFNGETDKVIDFVVHNELAVLSALRDDENRKSVLSAVALLRRANKIGIFGIGALGHLAEQAVRLFEDTGTDAYALSSTGQDLVERLSRARPGQVLIVMLYGRGHLESQRVMAHAEQSGIPVIMLLGRQQAAIRRRAAVSILIARSEEGKVALHASYLLLLEAFALGLCPRGMEGI